MGASFFILWSKVVPPDPQIETEKVTGTIEKENESSERPMHELETFIVNLSDRGCPRYLRTTMVLELTSEETIDEIEKRLSQMRDVVLMIIPTKKSKDIITVEGKRALGDEIMSELNYILKNGSVTNVFFTEFVIQ